MALTQKDLQERADNDLRRVLSTESGRRVLWELMDGRASVFRPSYAGEQTHHTAYLEGRRSVGLELVLECQRVSPADWGHMMREALERRQEVLDVKEPADGR